MSFFIKVLLVSSSILSFTTGALANNLSKEEQLARDIYKQAVETETSIDQPGSTIVLANLFKSHLKAAGFEDDDISILEMGDFGALMVRYRAKNDRR